MNYFTSGGLPLRGNESETVSGIIIPEPGEDAHWRAVAYRKLIFVVMCSGLDNKLCGHVGTCMAH